MDPPRAKELSREEMSRSRVDVTCRQSSTGTGAARRSSLPDVHLVLLGKLDLTVAAHSSSLIHNAQRVVAFLALQNGPVSRVIAARTLWPDVTEAQASAKLRSVLWRLQQHCRYVVESMPRVLRLHPYVHVDFYDSIHVAARLLDRSAVLTPQDLSVAMRVNLSDDLLPYWHDESWLAPEQERFHQLRLHALERLCDQLISAEWYGAAVDAALSAVRADSFRESARAGLIRAYLAEGNHYHALAEYDSYRKLLTEELGMEPSTQLSSLIDGH